MNANIEVKNLVKKFGKVVAVDNISFTTLSAGLGPDQPARGAFSG
jgi:ABC-type multidrug transport system ATPase subunit